MLQSFNKTILPIQRVLPAGNNVRGMSYDIFSSTVYIHFAVKGGNLDLEEIQEYSDKIVNNSLLVGRPLLIYNFDPSRGMIILNSPYCMEKVTPALHNAYFLIEFSKKGRKYKAYIFDHTFEDNDSLSIATMNDNEYMPLGKDCSYLLKDPLNIVGEKIHQSPAEKKPTVEPLPDISAT